MSAQGAEALTEAELLALVLRSGDTHASAHQIALRVLGRCGGLLGLARSSRAELMRIAGVGEAKSAALLATLELGRRLHAKRLVRGSSIGGPADVFRHFHALMTALLRYGAAGSVDFLVLVVAHGLGFPYRDMVNPRPSRRLRARSVPDRRARHPG